MLLSDACLVYVRPKSRTGRPRKTKFGTEVAHVTRDSDTTSKLKRSKVKVTRPLWLVVLAGQHGHTVMVTYPYAFADICLSADEKLFSAVIRDSDHVLHKLLPPLSTASQCYNLRECKHNYLLPLRTGRLSDHNFIQRMLYLDV